VKGDVFNASGLRALLASSFVVVGIIVIINDWVVLIEPVMH